MRTEDDIRTALRTLADTAPDAHAVLSALPLASQSGRGDRARRRSSLTRLVAPATAAVAVLAIVATSIALRTGDRPGRAPTLVTGMLSKSVPPYYVAIMTAPRGIGLVTTVRDTRTGAALATVHPPAGYWFIDAASGARNDSFLLIANQHHGPPGLYLMRFDPANRRINLTRLPIAVALDTDGLVMSPSGAEVAVASGTNTGKVPSQLRIYTLSGRLIREWQDPGTICLAPWQPCLSWAASGYLAFSWNNNNANLAAEGERLIRATAASGSLLRASRLILPFKTLEASTAILSGNGTTIAAVVPLRSRPHVVYGAFEKFSTGTGKLLGRFGGTTDQGGPVAAYWSNWSGSELLVLAQFQRPHRSPRLLFGTLTRRRFTPLSAAPAGDAFGFAF